MNSKKQGMLGAVNYAAFTSFPQNQSLIGMIERDGPCRWLVELYALDFVLTALDIF